MGDNVDDDEEDTSMLIDVADLPDALDIATYSHQKHTLLIDNSEAMGSRFLRYQRGCYLQYHQQNDVEPESLRKNLIGALQYGSNFVLSFDNLPCDDASVLLENETSFPVAALDRSQIFMEETWSPLLREEKGDPSATHFLPLDNFKMIFITKQDPPQQGLLDLVGKNMAIIRIRGTEGDGGKGTNSGSGTSASAESDAIVAGMFGLKLVKRNSEAMCDAAFDGELDLVKEELDKGFDLESTDKSGATSLSEASAQGKINIVKYLIELGESCFMNLAIIQIIQS